MNKSNKLLVGILAFVVVCIIGYALFSETITVTGTATASGSFDIEYDCSVVIKETAINSSFTLPISTGTGSCTIENDTIKTISTLNKPDDYVSYHVKLTNAGTIPAVLKTVNSSNNYSADISVAGDYTYFDKTYYLMAYYGIVKGESNPYMGDAVVENAKLTIQPGETIDLAILHSWYSTDEQPELPEGGKNMTYNIELGFEQITVN